jgi:hypothetical protein
VAGKKLTPEAPHFTETPAMADAAAIQALAAGEATPDQQRRALAWIVNVGCRTYDLSWRFGDPHSTSFAEGRRFAGMEIVRVMKVNVEQLRKQGQNG